MRDGSRQVTRISEIVGTEGETVVQQEIYKFFDQGDNPDGSIKGYHGPTGVRPMCDAMFKRYGFNLPGSLFMKIPKR